MIQSFNSTEAYAIIVADKVHGKQKYGAEPYMNHVKRVADAFAPLSDERVVAILHDAAEDHPLSIGAGLANIHKLFPSVIFYAVDAITRQYHKYGDVDRMSYDDYILLVAANPVARRVKIADLADNLSNCVANLGWGNQIKQYQKALQYLLRSG